MAFRLAIKGRRIVSQVGQVNHAGSGRKRRRPPPLLLSAGIALLALLLHLALMTGGAHAADPPAPDMTAPIASHALASDHQPATPLPKDDACAAAIAATPLQTPDDPRVALTMHRFPPAASEQSEAITARAGYRCEPAGLLVLQRAFLQTYRL